MSRARAPANWRYRAWREAELPLLVDDPACVCTTDLAVPEADPAERVAAQTDDVMDRLEPKLRRLLHARANAGDEKGVWHALEATLRVVAAHEPRARFVAAVRSRRNADLVFGLLHDRIDLDAVTLSRGRVYQILAFTVFRWGRARFPALLAWWDGERHDAVRRAARRAPRRWARRQAREPAPPPYVLPAWMQAGAATWLANAARDAVPNPHEWLQILSRVRPVTRPDAVAIAEARERTPGPEGTP